MVLLALWMFAFAAKAQKLTESSECDLSQEADSFCFAKKGFVANKQDELETFLILVLFFVVLVFLCRVDTSTSPSRRRDPGSHSITFES